MELDAFMSDGAYWSSATPLNSLGQSSPLQQIPDCDLITFIAIAQSADVDFIDIEWHQGLGSAGEGATTRVQQSLANSSTSLAYKQLLNGQNKSDVYKTALSEILILQHPLIRHEEFIIDLYGVGWHVDTESDDEDPLIPVLVYENASQYGNLHSFLWRRRPTIQAITGESSLEARAFAVSYEIRLRFCIQIGEAIQAMHSCNVIHGDLKPQNILVFPASNRGGFIPKVIDFGYSTYGLRADDLVKLPCTKEWMAPEWHHRAFRIQDAKKVDIYTYARICDRVLNHFHGDRMDYVFPKPHVSPHMRQFYELALCEDPQARTDNITLLLSILIKALNAESDCFLHDLLLQNRSALETQLMNNFGPEKAMKQIEKISTDAQERLSGPRSLNENDLKCQPTDTLNLLRKDLPRILDITKDFLDLQAVHFLVRRKIYEGLLEWSRDWRQPQILLNDIAFQLALCYELAFGVKRNVRESQKWLHISGRDASHLAAELDKLRSEHGLTSDVKGVIYDSKAVDIAYRYMAAGQLGDAIELYTLESQGKFSSLGPTAPATLTSQTNLAALLDMAGRHDEAINLLWKMLETCEKDWGPDSDWSLMLQLNISRVLAGQGDFPRAISIAEGLLRKENSPGNREEILQALSSYFGQTCDFERSTRYVRQLWEERKTSLGETHPQTMNALELLSYATTDVDMEEAEAMEAKVLYWRQKVMGDDSQIVLDTMKNLAFVKANIKGKETEGIDMQRELLSRIAKSPGSSWLQIVSGTDRLAWMLETTNRIDEAIASRAQLMNRMDDLLSCQQGLALLGNHAGNLKKVGRDQEANALRFKVLHNVPLVLKPIPRIGNAVIRGVACAFRIDGEFDQEATTIYMEAHDLWKRLSGELGELHPRTLLVLRFLQLLLNAGYIVQASIHFLGLEHATTRLAIIRLKNSLSSFVRDDAEVEDYVLEAIDWIERRITVIEGE